MILNKQQEFKSNAAGAEEFISSYCGLSGAYPHIADAGDFSLQKISYDEDERYLKKILSTLQVISSIAAKPHVSTKREEIFTRIEQAGQITSDEFSRVCRDTSLWKRRGVRMIPEEIYYYHSEDELAIYENRFIVLLVNLLAEEIIETRNVYSERLPKLNETGDILNVDDINSGRTGAVLESLKDIEKRIGYIKNTDFYKIVSKEKLPEGRITPTNILLKDLKYRTCFKFYNGYLKYSHEGEFAENMLSVTEIYILKALRSLGYDFNKESESIYKACNDKFALEFKFIKSGVVILSVTRGGFTVKHALFTYNADKDHALKTLENLNETDFISVETVGIWSLKDLITGETLSKTDMSEEEFVGLWLLSKTKLINSDSAAYKKYCPVCGGVVYDKDKKLVCGKCGSEYTYGLHGTCTGEIWLLKLRRGV